MKIDINSTYILELFVVGISGEAVTGLTTSYTIYQSSDNSVINSGSLTDQGNGIYTASYNFSSLGQFLIIYNTPSGYNDENETVLVENSNNELLKRIIGLVQENFRIFETTYDGSSNLTSSIVKTYESAIDCENDTNVLASYEVTATYDLNGKMLSYKSKKI